MRVGTKGELTAFCFSAVTLPAAHGSPFAHSRAVETFDYLMSFGQAPPFAPPFFRKAPFRPKRPVRSSPKATLP